MTVSARAMRWVFLAIVACCGVIAVFTTFDTIDERGVACGSPSSPLAASPACETSLGHARATRTAALVWALPALGAAWFFDRRTQQATPASEYPSY